MFARFYCHLIKSIHKVESLTEIPQIDFKVAELHTKWISEKLMDNESDEETKPKK